MEHFEFERFIQQYEKDIYSFCCHLKGNTQTADDLYQETLLQAFKLADRMDGSNNPKSYIFSIAIKKLKNEQRKSRRRTELAPTFSYEDLTEEPADHTTTESQAEQNALHAQIKHAVNQMDLKYRLPIILHYFNGDGIEEISKLCGIPKGTVKSRLSKGRELLKEALRKEGYHYEP